MGVEAGTVLGGKFVVERVLGEGGMGMVVAATHLELGHRVAIKMMLPQAKDHPEMLARFEREARAAAGLSSEHAARVTDVGRFDDGMPFMVMEFLEGEDLEAAIARTRQLPINEIVRYFQQACIGLGDAHSLGIVHRDIKPSNLFLAQRPGGRVVLKVLDFGIAKANLSSTNPQLTRTSTQMGSPQYMSPEQLRDTKSVDARTDIWSLGAAMYEATTGVAAFPAHTLAELHVKILTEPPVHPRALRPEVPFELERVLLRCLEKDAANRYASLAEVREELEVLEVKISASRSSPTVDISLDGTALPSLAPPPPAFRVTPGVDSGLAFAGTDIPTSRTFAGDRAPKGRGGLPRAAMVGGVALVAVASLVAVYMMGRSASPLATAPTVDVPAPSPAAAPAPPAAAKLEVPPVQTERQGAGAPQEEPAPKRDVRPARAAAERPSAVAAPTKEPAPAERPKAPKKKSSALDPELEE